MNNGIVSKLQIEPLRAIAARKTIKAKEPPKYRGSFAFFTPILGVVGEI